MGISEAATGVVLEKKGCSQKFCNIRRKASALECLFNEVVGLQKKLQHGCFPVNIAKFLCKPILKNICKRLFFQYK